MPVTNKIIVALISLSSMYGNQSHADAKPASPFSDHMVLQYNTVVPVWGTADPGEKITVQIGKQIRTAVTNADGQWMLKLNKIAAGGPYTMTITGKNKIVINDVYAGEVWICSGQSNMDMTVAREDRYWCGVFNEKEEENREMNRVFPSAPSLCAPAIGPNLA